MAVGKAGGLGHDYGCDALAPGAAISPVATAIGRRRIALRNTAADAIRG
jgi:hypothetical protein